MLVPSNKALDMFSNKMGLTEQALLARPGLVDDLLSYHFMPGYAINSTANIPANTMGFTKGISGEGRLEQKSAAGLVGVIRKQQQQQTALT
jgi:hypothetical protein